MVREFFMSLGVKELRELREFRELKTIVVALIFGSLRGSDIRL